MENNTVNYELLREQLKLVSKEFNACDSFIKDIEQISDKISFKRFFQRHIIDIGERLHCDLADENEVSDLKDEIDDLEYRICSLEDELDDYKTKFGVNKNLLSEDYKIKWFLDNKDRYTEWELKDLLENGSTLLNYERI